VENLLRIYIIRFLLSIPVGLVFILFVLSPLVRLLLVYDGPPKRGEFAKYLVKIYSVEAKIYGYIYSYHFLLARLYAFSVKNSYTQYIKMLRIFLSWKKILLALYAKNILTTASV